MGQYYNVYLKEPNGKEHGFENFDWFKLTEHSWIGNPFTESIASLIYHQPSQIMWVGDYTNDVEALPNAISKATANNAYKLAWKNYEETPYEVFNSEDKWLVNHTKKEYTPCAVSDEKMHILPLLTVISNGLGGGDFFGTDKGNAGAWANDVFSIEDEPPKGYNIHVFAFKE